jgi:GntR family transcriptional regulator of abcA and norABC
LLPVLPLLDRKAPEPLADQIAAFFGEAIRAGRLRPGERLPPIRAVAEGAGVTRTTVQTAYRQLGEVGLVSGEVGRGTLVLPQGDAAARPQPLSPFAEAALLHAQNAPQAPALPAGQELVANFADLAPDGALFPLAELRAALDRVLRERGAELLGYQQPAGLPALRTLLARREGPAVSPESVLVTSGAQQGIDLVLRSLCAPGDAVVVPVPTYQQLFGLLKAHGLRCLPVPCSAAGIDLAALERALAQPDVRLLYLMPTFHNPTGRTLDLAQRRELIALLGRSRVVVLEDEFEQALRFAGDDLPTLQSLDPRGLCVTVRTFSKGLLPGLRVGWVRAHDALLQPMAAVKRFMDLETSPLLQAALCGLIEQGHLDRCLDDLRRELAARHRTAHTALRRCLPPQCRWAEPEGGPVLWLELPEPGQGDRLSELAAARGVRTVPGRVFDPDGRPSRGLRLSLSRSDQGRIARGIEVLAACAREVLLPPAPTQLFL